MGLSATTFYTVRKVGGSADQTLASRSTGPCIYNIKTLHSSGPQDGRTGKLGKLTLSQDSLNFTAQGRKKPSAVRGRGESGEQLIDTGWPLWPNMMPGARMGTLYGRINITGECQW